VLGSAGFGIRFRFGGVLVLRFDFGKKFTIRSPERLTSYLHPELQHGVFKQVFFGWDF